MGVCVCVFFALAKHSHINEINRTHVHTQAAKINGNIFHVYERRHTCTQTLADVSSVGVCACPRSVGAPIGARSCSSIIYYL